MKKKSRKKARPAPKKKAVARRKGSSARRAPKRKAASRATKSERKNPQTPLEVALHLIANRGKRGASAYALTQAKHAKRHGQKAEAKRWKAIRSAIARVRMNPSRPSSRRSKGERNPLLGIVNPQLLKSYRVGDKCRFGDLPEALQRNALVKKAARDAADFDGVDLEDVKVEVGLAGDGDPDALTGIGGLRGIQYAKGRRAARNGLFWHKAGDHGGGKNTQAQIVAADPRTGRTILVDRRGTRAGFKSDRGLVG